MAKAERGANDPDDTLDVSSKETRGERYRPLAVLAGQRLTTRKAELEREMGRKIPLRELQEATGVDFGSISEILNGLQANVSVGNFFAICEALKIDPLKAWYGDARKPPVGTRRSEPPPASMSRPSTAPPPPEVPRPQRRRGRQ